MLNDENDLGALPLNHEDSEHIEEPVPELVPDIEEPVELEIEELEYIEPEAEVEPVQEAIPGSLEEENLQQSSLPIEEKIKKKDHKIAAMILAGVVFGVVAGTTMVGIQAISSAIAGRDRAESNILAELEEQLKEETVVPQTKVPVPAVSTTVAADIPEMVEQVMPSVVAINNTMLYQDYSWFGAGQTYEVPSSGSGIIVGENDNELLIVTNNHVVEGSRELKVNFIDGNSIDAAIKGTDAVFDLAVIAVPLEQIPEETRAQISIANLGDSSELRVGETVVAIGNALGYGQSVTVGCISAINREIETERETITNLLQTDAAINPGNSGGALLNLKGEVIGINAAKYSSTAVEGMGYAIPISEAQEIIDQLMNKKTRIEVAKENQGYLGIQGKDITDAYAAELGMPKGVYVYRILEDQAAAETDLREKDIITKFDDQSIRTMADLQEMLTYYEGGDVVRLTVQSQEGGQYVERMVEITLGFKPTQPTE